ncbi:MAG TPA: ATP-grasp domain-containing protein [Actinocrinis sp.]|uniref:ATP-grasp domain-containing protein n=1 Tax=Actinocrinis sp. TaxID=1920516 RepID=UPI002DDC935A|nr:ATP-grasp domain-containing protein [Actinocrinis sp.]HEV3172571.1 ATP-grasp domain-containing protein [Actinocrinis sp.]
MDNPDKPTVLVVYDVGSTPPTRLAEAAGRLGCSLVFVCSRPFSAHVEQIRPLLEMCGAVVDVPQDADAREAAALVAPLRPAGIVTFAESRVGATAELAAALGLPYQDVADIPAITTKAAQRERLRDAGIDEVRCVRVERADQADEALARVGLPAIVKPDLGVGSRSTVLVHTAEEFHRIIAELLDDHEGGAREAQVVVEEAFVGRETPSPWGDYVAVDTLSRDGVVEPIFATGKFAPAEPFRERGGYGPPVLPAAELAQVEKLAVRAVQALNIRHGAADVEMKLTPNGPRVIEVNGRLGGWVDDLAVRSGIGRLAEAVLSQVLGLPAVPVVKAQRIAYNYVAASPVAATRVRALSGLAKLRKLDGVERVTVLKRPGERVDWRLGTDPGSVAAVAGVAASHDELAALVGRVASLDWAEFDED